MLLPSLNLIGAYFFMAINYCFQKKRRLFGLAFITFLFTSVIYPPQSIRIKVENKIITIPNMEIKSSALSVFISGSHTFNQDINYDIKLLEEQLDDNAIQIEELNELLTPKTQEEEEKCPECKKPLEGDDKCGEGCKEYDAGWKETHGEGS